MFVISNQLMKESLGVMIKLLSCDLVVTSSSHGYNFLQYKIRLYIIDQMRFDSSLGPLIG